MNQKIPKHSKLLVDETKQELMIFLEKIAKKNGFQLDSFVCSVSFSDEKKSVGFTVVDVNDDNENDHVQDLPDWVRLGRVFESSIASFNIFQEKHFSKKS